MKILYCVIIQILLTANIGISQEKHTINPSLIVKVTYNFSAALTNYENGSAFSLVVFNLDSDGKFTKISVVSTNKIVRKIIDSFLTTTTKPFEFKEKKVGNFAVPIVQIMVGDNPNNINWNNNSSWEMAKFGKHLDLPVSTILLNPIFIMGSPVNY